MKHLFLYISVPLFILFILSGCVSGTKSLQQTQDTGYLIGEKILDSIRKKDYAQLSGTLARYGGPLLSEEQYLHSEKEFSSQFGSIVSFRYLTELQTPGVRNFLWIVTLEKQSLLQKEKKIHQELLFRLVIAENRKEGKVWILGMGFF